MSKNTAISYDCVHYENSFVGSACKKFNQPFAGREGRLIPDCSVCWEYFKERRGEQRRKQDRRK